MPMLQHLNPEVKTIAMSGIYSASAIDNAYDLGFQSFLSKPISTQELLKVLRCCLET